MPCGFPAVRGRRGKPTSRRLGRRTRSIPVRPPRQHIARRPVGDAAQRPEEAQPRAAAPRAAGRFGDSEHPGMSVTPLSLAAICLSNISPATCQGKSVEKYPRKSQPSLHLDGAEKRAVLPGRGGRWLAPGHRLRVPGSLADLLFMVQNGNIHKMNVTR